MHQKPLLDDTKAYLRPSERKQRGIKFHEKYSESIYRISAVLLVGLLIHWYLFDYRFALVFGAAIFLVGVSSEVALKQFYGFNGRDAVKYYALKMYENPSRQNLKQLQSWNKNPFDLTTEYYYPRIGDIIEQAQSKNDPFKYVSENLPDALRLIERRERDDYYVLMDIKKVEDYNLTPYYKKLLQEVNYCYKFGAYTSASMLLRKITENLIEDILFTKGFYSELPQEPTFQEMVELFVSEVLTEQFNQDIADDLQESLDEWIRKKGNKGAHIPEEFSQEEIETLMHHAQKAVRLLIVIRSELEVDTEDLPRRQID